MYALALLDTVPATEWLTVTETMALSGRAKSTIIANAKQHQMARHIRDEHNRRRTMIHRDVLPILARAAVHRNARDTGGRVPDADYSQRYILLDANRVDRLTRWDRIAQQLARALQVEAGVAPASLFGRDRRPNEVLARRALIHALVQYGAGITEIGHVLRKDHSTVLHHLKRQKDHDEAVALAERCMTAVAALMAQPPESTRSLPWLPESHIVPLLRRSLPPGTAPYVVSYIQMRVFASNRQSGPVAALGMRLVAEDRAVNRVVASVLTRCGHGDTVAGIRSHCLMRGYGWVGDADQQVLAVREA